MTEYDEVHHIAAFFELNYIKQQMCFRGKKKKRNFYKILITEVKKSLVFFVCFRILMSCPSYPPTPNVLSAGVTQT